MLISLNEMVNEFKLKIKGVLHVGAHECEELGFYLTENISSDNIYWIEAQDALVQRNKQRHANIKIYTAAISNVDNEERDFIVTNNYQSSSLLELKDHLTEHPGIHEINRYTVKTKRMETLINENNIDMTSVNFMNIDIQGMELECLKSMGKYLDSIDYIYTEINVKELYANCALLDQLDAFLASHNFKRVKTDLTSYGWGDSLYIRTTDV